MKTPFILLLTVLAVNPVPGQTVAPAEKDALQAKPLYEQKLFGAPAQLVAPEVLAETIGRFKAAYRHLGSPRFLIYVNRELIDQHTGLKLAGREETVVNTRREAAREVTPSEREGESLPPAGGVTTSTSVTLNPTNGGAGPEPKGHTADTTESPALRANLSTNEKKVATVNRYERTEREDDSFEYRQLARDIEIVFGRRLRSAGANLADQKIAAALIADRALRDFSTPTEGEQARKDREALTKVADVVVEILIAYRETQVTQISGDATRMKPEIQVTAIRLADSRIMGQATSADVMGSSSRQNQILHRYTSRDIADATALRLMDDMLLGLNDN